MPSFSGLSRLPIGNRSAPGRLSVAKQSLVAGNRSALGRLSDGNRRFPIGYRLPKWGARKYYLLSHQPESGWCGLQVILLYLNILENPGKNICEGGQARLSKL